MESSPLEALRQGWFESAADTLQPLGDGHINDTYLAQRSGSTDALATDQYVLQRVSERVFVSPETVMSNVSRVLEHCAGSELPLPELITTRLGRGYWVDEDGSVWRLWRFRPGTRVLNAPLSADDIQLAGWAFGRFQRLMNNLPPPSLAPVIDGFLDLRHYLWMFEQTLSGTRHEGCGPEVDFVAATQEVLRDQLMPGRDYIHGDCKLDNLLFDAARSRLDCVIDLDTVMLGHWAWDFGDLVRSISTTAGAFDPELVIAAARGFCAGRGNTGPVGEQQSRQSDESAEGVLEALLAAPGYVTFMLAVRFLMDHLRGDQYFKVAQRGENLIRARTQIALYRNFAQHLPQLKDRLSASIR
jgi:aminoglycoside phosphotransferase (APT) family kinase protein